jgi:hypothetical protein
VGRSEARILTSTRTLAFNIHQIRSAAGRRSREPFASFRRPAWLAGGASMKARVPVVARTWIWIAVALAAGAATGIVSAHRSLTNDETALSAMR